MKPKIIFDLSEVLIMGLVGIERQLSPILKVPESEILPSFDGPLLQPICRGEISEDQYLGRILEKQGWQVSIETLKLIIRENFHQKVEGTHTILGHLVKRYEVVLLSGHVQEWVAYIQTIHPFLETFKQAFFSYEIGQTKKIPASFAVVLKEMSYQAEACWLIDDSKRNIAVAASLGINGIQFSNAEQLREQLVGQGIW
ncbi:MAG: HAD hydrolase-like protein [Deltaproteobacteria bacterium]|nr:HAD hydrolase-like protein [Deltaproteobacteria bacterium]